MSMQADIARLQAAVLELQRALTAPRHGDWRPHIDIADGATTMTPAPRQWLSLHEVEPDTWHHHTDGTMACGVAGDIKNWTLSATSKPEDVTCPDCLAAMGEP